jgi:2-polyprenyl-6-methoxyphenol hydroxylase-like FAD-dependent oxidoreductase
MSRRFGEVGAGIGISESAIEIFSKLGLTEAIISKGRFIEDAVIVDKHKKIIRKLPIKNGGFCLHRSTLIDVLAADINLENVSFEHEVSDVEIKDGVSVIKFTNGITKRYSSVIACDGINSTIRKKFLSKVKKRYSGQTVWRGISNVELPEDFKEVYYEFWGENKLVATIPLNNKQYYWYVVKCADAGEKDTPESVKNDLKALFKNYETEVQRVIDNTTEIIRNDMWDIKPTNSNWHRKNVFF